MPSRRSYTSIRLLLATLFAASLILFPVQNTNVVKFAHGAIPTDCNLQTFSAVQTLTFDPADSTEADGSGYTVQSNRCTYNGGLRIQTTAAASTSVARTPIFNVQLLINGATATTINFDDEVLFGKGSSVTIQGSTITSGSLFAYASLSDASLRLSFVTLSSQILLGTSTIGGTRFVNSEIVLDNVRVTTSAQYALRVSDASFRNSAFIARHSLFKSTSTSSSFALQWGTSPMLPNDEGHVGKMELTLHNNTFEGENGCVMATQTDWNRNQNATFTVTSNRFRPRLATSASAVALRLWVNGQRSFTFQDNIVNNGVVEIIHLTSTENFKFYLEDSNVFYFVYRYLMLQNTSLNEQVVLKNVLFAANGNQISLPTSTNAVIRFDKCRSTVAANFAITFRSLNTGTVHYKDSNFVGAMTVTTSYVSYKLTQLVENTRISACVNMKFWELYYSNVSFVGGSLLGCLQLEGQVHGSSFNILSSTVSPIAATPTIVNFLNDWHDSDLVVSNSTLSTGTDTASSHRLILFTGKVLNKVRHTFINNVFNHLALGSPSSGVVPRSCVVGYSRKSSMPSYLSIKDQSSVTFRGNRAFTSARDAYLLYAHIEGGELIWDNTNSARGTAVSGMGRIYINNIAPSVDTIQINLRNIINFFQIDVLRYLASQATSYEDISITETSCASIYIYAHTAVGLNLRVANVTATKLINLQGASITNSEISFFNVTTPSLYQSITVLRTSTLQVRNSRPNLLQHFVTSVDGCSLAFVNNVFPTSHFRLRGGLFDSQSLILNNVITSATAYSIYMDDYDIGESTLDVINNTIATTSTGTTYGIYWLKSSGTMEAKMNFIGNKITKSTHSFHGMVDLRQGCTLYFAKNEFTTAAASGYIYRLNITGARIVHEPSNRLHLGRIYIYHHISSFGNYFAMDGTYGVHTPNTLEWIYYSAGHTAVKDTIDIRNTYFTGAVKVQFPMARNSFVRFNNVRGTNFNLHHREGNQSTVWVEKAIATGYYAMSSTLQCIGCSFNVVGSSGKYVQFTGPARNKTHFAVRGSTLQYFISTTRFEDYSGLTLFGSTMIGTRIPTVALGGGWDSFSYLLVDSCTITADYRVIAITQHAMRNSTHTFANNIISALKTTTSYTNYITPAYGCIIYTRSIYTAAANAPSIGYASELAVYNNTFNVQYAHSYVLHATSKDGGRIVMENGNMIRPTPATSALGRIYINSISTDPRGPTALGHKIVLTSQPRFYHFHIARTAGTTGYSEQFELHDCTYSYSYIYTANSRNLKVYFSNNVANFDTYIYGTNAEDASITFRGIRGRTLYQSITQMTASHTDILGNTLTAGMLYHQALSMGQSLITIADNTLTGTKFLQLRGGCFDSQLQVNRNRMTTSAAYALLADAYTIRGAAAYFIGNTLTSTSSTGAAVLWRKSLVYSCGDAIFVNNSFSGGFDMLTPDIGQGGQAWFRGNTFTTTSASRYAFRLTVGAGGRFDYDGTNRIVTGIARTYHTYHTSRNNVLVIGPSSTPARVDWLYSFSNGTAHNDTIVLNGFATAGYISISVPSIHNSVLNITNVKSSSYILILMTRGDRSHLVVQGCTATYVHFKPAAGVSSFSDSTVGVRDTTVTTHITLTGNYYNSTVYAINTKSTSIVASGLVGPLSTLMLRKVTVEGTINHAGNIQSLFDSGTLIVEDSRFVTTNYKAFVLTQTTKGRTTHIFTNNYFSQTSISTTYTVTPSPRFCALCYTYSGTSFVAIAGDTVEGGAQAMAVFKQNRFRVRYASAYLIFITVGQNAKIYFDESNYNVPYDAAAATPQGYYRFGFIGTTAPGSLVNITGGGNRLNNVIVEHKGTAKDDMIVIGSHTPSIVKLAVTYNLGENVTVKVTDTTLLSAATIFAANVGAQSLFDFHNIATAFALTFRLRCVGGSTVSLRSSRVNTVSYMTRILDRSTFNFEKNTFTSFSSDSTGQLAVVDSNAIFYFANNTAVNNAGYILDFEDLTVKNRGKVILFGNSLVSTAATSYAVYWEASPITTGGEVMVLHNIFHCHFGFWMSTTSTTTLNLGVGAKMWFRGNTFTSRTASRFALSLKVGGGVVDHDETNKYISGGIEIIHYANSANNTFVLSQANLGIDFDIRYSAPTLTSTNDVYVLKDCTMTTANINIPRLTNTTIHVANVATTADAIDIDMLTASNSNILIENISALAFPIELTVGTQANASIFGISNVKMSAIKLIIINVRIAQGSLLYIKDSTLAALEVQGSIANSTVSILDTTFTSFVSVSSVLFSCEWRDALLDFIRSKVSNVVIARSVTIAGLLYGKTVHRFIDSAIHNRATAATTSMPAACALCYARISSTGPFPTIPFGGALIVKNTALSTSLAAAYLLYASTDGGAIDISDSNNAIKGTANEIGRVFLGLGVQSVGSTVAATNLVGLNAMEVGRVASAVATTYGENETILLHNIGAVTITVDFGNTRRSKLQLTGNTAKTLIQIDGDNVDASELLMLDNAVPTFSKTIANLSASLMVLNGTLSPLSDLNLNSVARHGTRMVVGNTRMANGNVQVAGGLHSGSIFTFADNHITAAAKSPFTASCPTTTGSKHFFLNNVFSVSGSGNAFHYESGDITASEVVFENNIFGQLSLTTGTSTHGFHCTSYLFGAGSTATFRSNTFFAPHTTPVAFRFRGKGGTIDLDASNTVRGGGFEVFHSASSANNRVTLKGQRTMSSFGYDYTSTTFVGLNDTIQLDNCATTTTTAGIVVALGNATRNRIRFSNVGHITTAPLTVTAQIAIESQFEIVDPRMVTGAITLSPGVGTSTRNRITISGAQSRGALYYTTGVTNGNSVELLNSIFTLDMTIAHGVSNNNRLKFFGNTLGGDLTVSHTSTMIGCLYTFEKSTVDDLNFDVTGAVTSTAFKFFNDFKVAKTVAIDTGAAKNVIFSFDGVNVGTTSRVTTKAPTSDTLIEIVDSTLIKALTVTTPSSNNTLIKVLRTSAEAITVNTATLCTYSLLQISDSTLSGTLTITGTMGMGRRVRLVDSTLTSGLVMSGTATSNALFEILRAKIAHTSHGLTFSGDFTDNAKLSIRDTVITVTTTSIGLYVTRAMSHISMINSAVKAGTGLAVRISVTGTGFVSKTAEIIGNEFSSTNPNGAGVTINTYSTHQRTILANNKINGVTTFVMGSAASTVIASCNVGANNAAITVAGSVTNQACSVSVTRCNGFGPRSFPPSSYTRSATLVVDGAADAALPECDTLMLYQPTASAPAPTPSEPSSRDLLPFTSPLAASDRPAVVNIAPENVNSVLTSLRTTASERFTAVLGASLFELARLYYGQITMSSFVQTAVRFIRPIWDRCSPSWPSPFPPVPVYEFVRGPVYADLVLQRYAAMQPFPRQPILDTLPAQHLMALTRDATPCNLLVPTTTPPPTTVPTTITQTATTLATTTVRVTETDPPTTTTIWTTIVKTTKPTTAILPTTTAVFSDLFSDDGGDEPPTTPEDTRVIVIPDETDPPSNSDIATVPDKFTPPPITEDMFPVTDPEPASEATEPQPTAGPVYPPENNDPPENGNVPDPPEETYTIPAGFTEPPYVEPTSEDDEEWFPSQDSSDASSGDNWGESSGSGAGDEEEPDFSDFPADFTDPPDTSAAVAPTDAFPSSDDHDGDVSDTSGDAVITTSDTAPTSTTDSGDTVVTTLTPTNDTDSTTAGSEESETTNSDPDVPSDVVTTQLPTADSSSERTHPTTTNSNSSADTDADTTSTSSESSTSDSTTTADFLTSTAASLPTDDENRDDNRTTSTSTSSTSPSPSPATMITTSAMFTSTTSSSDTNDNGTADNGHIEPTADTAPTHDVVPPASSSEETTTAAPSRRELTPTASHSASVSRTEDLPHTQTIPLSYTCPRVIMSVVEKLQDVVVLHTARNNSANNNQTAITNPLTAPVPMMHVASNKPRELLVEAERLESVGLTVYFSIAPGEATRLRFKTAPIATGNESTSPSPSWKNGDANLRAYLIVAEASTGIKAVGSFEHTFGERILLPCAVLSETTIRCELASPDPAFNPPRPERLIITLPSDAFEIACDDTAVAFSSQINIAALLRGNAAEEAAASIAGVASGSAGAAGLLAGAAAFDAYMLGMLLNSPCASASDHRRSSVMMYIIAPMKDLGSDDAAVSSAAMMVFGNIIILGLFAGCQFGLASYLKSSRRLATMEVFAAVYFPSLSYIMAELMYTGVAVGTFSLKDLGSGERPADIVALLMGLTTLVAVPASVLYTLIKVVNPRFHMYTQFLSRSAFRRLFLPQTFVRTEVQRRAFNRHVAPFASLNKSIFGIFTMPTILAGTAVLYLLPNAVDCSVKLWLFALVLVAAATALAVARPYRFHCDTISIVAALIALAVLTSIMAIQYSDNTRALETAQTVLSFIIFMLILGRVVITIATMVLEHKYWRHFQEQIVNDLQEEDLFNLKRDGGDHDYDENGNIIEGGGAFKGAVEMADHQPLKLGDVNNNRAAGLSPSTITAAAGAPSVRRRKSIAPQNDSFAVPMMKERNVKNDAARGADDDDDTLGLGSSSSSLSSEATSSDSDLDRLLNGGNSAASTPRGQNHSHGASVDSVISSEYSDSDISM